MVVLFKKLYVFIPGALFLSLKYEFVTPLTSLVVSVPEETKKGDLSEASGGHNRRHTKSNSNNIISFSSSDDKASGHYLLYCIVILLTLIQFR